MAMHLTITVTTDIGKADVKPLSKPQFVVLKKVKNYFFVFLFQKNTVR
jgi:hypothetical protein